MFISTFHNLSNNEITKWVRKILFTWKLQEINAGIIRKTYKNTFRLKAGKKNIFCFHCVQGDQEHCKERVSGTLLDFYELSVITPQWSTSMHTWSPSFRTYSAYICLLPSVSISLAIPCWTHLRNSTKKQNMIVFGRVIRSIRIQASTFFYFPNTI